MTKYYMLPKPKFIQRIIITPRSIKFFDAHFDLSRAHFCNFFTGKIHGCNFAKFSRAPRFFHAHFFWFFSRAKWLFPIELNTGKQWRSVYFQRRRLLLKLKCCNLWSKECRQLLLGYLESTMFYSLFDYMKLKMFSIFFVNFFLVIF